MGEGVGGEGRTPRILEAPDEPPAPAPQALSAAELRPSTFAAQLLAALGASDGRRKRRKRDTTPDTIGMGIKHALLAAAIDDDPDPDAFDEWLLAQCLAAGDALGPTRAMALDILADWRLALATPDFRAWLAAGAPSDDTRPGPDAGLDPR